MFSIILIIACMLLALPVVVFFIQIVCGIFPGKSLSISVLEAASIVILIPAHNEEEILANTIKSVLPHLEANDQVLVIADNCSDHTETVAESLGVETIRRENSNELGKGFAIDFGITHLLNKNRAFDALIILDADCMVESGEIRSLASVCIALKRPVQALYLMGSADDAGIGQKIAEFAWLVKGFVRSRGYSLLGLPCQLGGSGMAFPRELVEAGRFRSASIVEDLELGIGFAMQGHAPVFYPDVKITSTFPSSRAGLKSQRQRWEHGHLGSIFRLTPQLIKTAIVEKNFHCLALALDLIVPPLALLSLIILILNIASFTNLLINGSSFPFLLSLILLSILVLGVLIAWARFGRVILSIQDLLYIPIYVLQKIPVYLRFFFNRQENWIKTPRGSQSSKED